MDPRKISTGDIAKTVVELIGRASFTLPAAVNESLIRLEENEEDGIGRDTLRVLLENAEIARAERLPLCQDCGSVIVFLSVGQDVKLDGALLEDAVNGAVADAYGMFNLRKSMVGDPLRRKNTGTNAPAFIHTEIVGGDRVAVTVYLKGGGSENMSSLRMFRPTDSAEDIIDYVVGAVEAAGPNPCPPVFLGIGIGGTADAAVINSKKAVIRGGRHHDPFYADLEERIGERLARTNIGPLGYGGRSTAAGVYIMEAPCHIATLPVAVNINCHSLRYMSAVI
ncbi:MAG: fumarate hydratase [Spirochaetes bacterium]|jgi:fumarate hydratase subunit alpha|nr:fumarate hydratase [Spirochaetota bacterium]